MSDNDSLMHQQAQAKPPPATDGWDDAAAEAAERTIRGQLLKFADWRWTVGKEATPIPDGTKLVALATLAMWVRWEDGKPVESRMREPGRRLPDREQLGYDDESKWQNPNGAPQDPWRNTRLVYLVHLQTAEAYTFSTSSWGGRGAVTDLGDQIVRMRAVHPEAVPIVELRSAEMPTKYGRKSKPLFKIVSWEKADAAAVAQAERQITAQRAEQGLGCAVIDDDIPF